MQNNSEKWVDFVVTARVYKTLTTRNFERRKPWVKPINGEVRALLPGTVLELLVAPGASVEQGDPIVRFEAMKTLNTIVAPMSGTVRSIEVANAQRLSKGDLMIVIE